MTNLFSPERGIYKVMTRIYQLLLLNILFILTSIPIFTIGASLCAAYGTSYKLQKGDEENLFKTYFKQFKANFKQGSLLWLGVVAVFSSIYLGYPSLKSFFATFPAVFYIFAFVLGIFLLTLLYLFPMTAKFSSSLGQLVTNSLILTLKHLPYSLIIFFFTGLVGIVLPIYLPQIWFLWLFLGFGTIIYFSSIILEKIFSLYGQTSKGR